MNFLARKRSGFTVIELVVAISIIGILAAIIITSYSAYRQDTYVTGMKRDLAAINLALEKYYAKNGSYPISASSGTAWNYRRASGEGFIPGLIPDYIRTVGDVPSGNMTSAYANTFIYRSDGREYRLIRLAESGGSVPDYERSSIEAALQDPNRWASSTPQYRGWGYWTPGGTY